MEKIIQWLLDIEQKAGRFYRDASSRFSHRKELSALLDKLAADEEWHASLMRTAGECVRTHDHKNAEIALDNETRERIRIMLGDCLDSIGGEQASEEALLDSIVTLELGELNHIFLYVINSLEQCESGLKGVAAGIQSHKDSLEHFISAHYDKEELLSRFRSTLPDVWEKQILIVDDTIPLLTMLADVFSSEIHVHTAEHGKAALEKVRASYYDAIISDITMPVMDGVAFYKEAVKIDPLLCKRFIFYSALPTEEQQLFIMENRLRLFRKPMPIQELRKAVIEILGSISSRDE